VLPKRWVVERSLGWLEKCRRLWKNCERKLNISLQFVHLALLVLLLRRSRTDSKTNIVIAYNSILLSGILNRYQTVGNQKALELLMRISSVAWQHIHFLGHYAFRDKQHPIDLEAILASVDLQ
jgi:ABC-type uncharacterized transport system YnjBCD permease subunit